MNVTTPLIRPTSDTRLLVETAVRTARREFRPNFNYAKAGIILVNLQPVSQHQGELDLFGSDSELAAPSRDRTALMDVRSWATRQERRSPRFTTRWEEMPIVKA